MKVGVISLGCDKNRVDTENIMTALRGSGYEFCAEPGDADVLMVNTCAFIESAREESVDAILEAAAYKRGKCRCLAVAGCLPMKYLDELKEGLPEVDLWLTPAEYPNAAHLLDGFLHRDACACAVSGRLLTTPEHYAYLKIADGCDNRCTYCTIPSIRGHYRSRSPEEIEREARSLVDGGVRELILVAQDVTRYGTDCNVCGGLVDLIDRLSAIRDLQFIRLLYCYPEKIDDRLIRCIADNPKVIKYIDVPLQHVDDGVLRRMGRKSTYDGICALIERLRAEVPGITIRSTFMLGFPGETQDAVDRLCAFLEQYRLDHVGFFQYSQEEGTPSARMDGQIDADVKRERYERAYALQQKIAFEKAREKIGSRLRVRYEEIDYDRSMFVARPLVCAPEIDYKVYFRAKFADIGRLYDVTVTDTDGYDLIAELESV